MSEDDDDARLERERWFCEFELGLPLLTREATHCRCGNSPKEITTRTGSPRCVLRFDFVSTPLSRSASFAMSALVDVLLNRAGTCPASPHLASSPTLFGRCLIETLHVQSSC